MLDSSLVFGSKFGKEIGYVIFLYVNIIRVWIFNIEVSNYCFINY